MTTTPTRSRPAFTLIEAVTTVLITGILAASVVPALATMRQAREAAAAAEIAQLLHMARAHAMSTGEPAGLTASSLTQAVTPVCAPIPGGGVEPLPDALGSDMPALILMDRYPGVAIIAVTGGGGETGEATIWFDRRGVPHRRNASGAYLADFTNNAVISVVGGRSVVVRRLSGVIE